MRTAVTTVVSGPPTYKTKIVNTRTTNLFDRGRTKQVEHGNDNVKKHFDTESVIVKSVRVFLYV